LRILTWNKSLTNIRKRQMQSNLVTKKPKNPRRKVPIKVRRKIRIKTFLVYLVKKIEKKQKPIMRAKKRRMEP